MRLTFVRQKPAGGGAVTFIFQPADPIMWQAGQSIRLELPTLMGASERRFTISSAPFERHIAITTRQSSSEFKQALYSLLPGQSVVAHGLEGSFIWEETAIAPLFVAAGIGITPFRPMIAQRLHDDMPVATTLLFAGRELIFADDFTVWQKVNPQVRVVHIADRRLHFADILAHDRANRLVYISGPAAMVDELSDGLIASAVPAVRIRRDWFTGNVVA